MSKLDEETGIGKRFGRLTVIAISESGRRICKCDCGRTLKVEHINLKRGLKRQCDECGKGICRFNGGVDCKNYTDRQCKACGWNPLVAFRRVHRKGEKNENEDKD